MKKNYTSENFCASEDCRAGIQIKKRIVKIILSLVLVSFLAGIQSIEAQIFKSKQFDATWDTWVYYNEGNYYLYYLITEFGFGEGVGVAVSTDGVHWDDQGLKIPQSAENSFYLGSGSVWKSLDFETSGLFICSYSEHRAENGRQIQKIFFATSTDLVNWTKADENTVFNVDTEKGYNLGGRWDGLSTFEREEGGLWGVWSSSSSEFPGSFGMGFTEDGISWTTLPPTEVIPGTSEPGGVRKIGDKYYGILNNKRTMFSFSADSPTGPYTISPKNDLLMQRDHGGFSRFFNGPDGIMINHHNISGLRLSPETGNRDISYLAPFKLASVDAEGIFRYKYWPGNEVLKENTLPTISPTSGPIQYVTNVLNMNKGIVMEASVAMKATDFTELIFSISRKNYAVRLFKDGKVQMGVVDDSGANFEQLLDIDREQTFGTTANLKILLRAGMMEIYLDNFFMETWTTRTYGAKDVRVGYTNGNRDINDIIFWDMSLEETEAPPLRLPILATASASTVRDGRVVAQNASDEDVLTRWSSARPFGADEWLALDFGEVSTFQDISINWEVAFAKTYAIQVSEDNTTWNTITTITDGDGTLDEITLENPVSSRYVRVLGTERGTEFGYSIYEFQVYPTEPITIVPAVVPVFDGPTSCDLDLSTGTLGTISGQDFGTTTVIENNYAIEFKGNLWKSIAKEQVITTESILEFEFKSTTQGEEHGIGFTNGAEYPNGTRFKLYGTQTIPSGNANGDFSYNGSGEYQLFSIPVGKFFTGTFESLAFISDSDEDPNLAQSTFRNIRLIIKDQTCSKREPVFTAADCAINLGDITIEGIAGQDSGLATINENGLGITVNDNAWKALKIPATIQSGTVLKFEFKATEEGEEHAIGFTNSIEDVTLVDGRRFKLYGTQDVPTSKAFQDFKYTNTGDWQSFSIPVSDFFTGDFQYMVFIADNDANASVGDSSFRNIQVVDASGECQGETTITEPNTSCEVNFAGAKSQNIKGQGNGAAVINESDLGVSINQNVWKAFAISKTIEEGAVLEFEFQSTEQGEEHAIGFTNNLDGSTFVDGTRFKLYGTQSVPNSKAFQNFEYTNIGEWQSFSVPVGEFFTGDFQNIVLIMDSDVDPNLGNSNFRNIRILNPDGSCQEQTIGDGSVLTNPPSINYIFNFAPEGTVSPQGWITESGAAFGSKPNGLSYGWSLASTDSATDFSGETRNRAPNPDFDVVRETLIHMNREGNQPQARWEVVVPNGEYQITLQVGDVNVETTKDTRHLIKAEGNIVIDFAPGNSFGTRTAITTVNVTDGRLTLDALDGINAKINAVVIQSTDGLRFPAVLASLPSDGATNISLNSSISANFLFLPNTSSIGATSLDNTSINNDTVKLFKIKGGVPQEVNTSANGTGGGDAINASVPTSVLEANTRYIYRIDGVRDLAGAEIYPFTAEFVTGSNSSLGSGNLDDVSFEKQGDVASGAYPTVTIGPDNKLYALAFGGEIHRWDINADGTLGNKEVLTGLVNARGRRLGIGFTFAPNATANNLVAYVTHSSNVFNGGPEFDGNLSRLSGANLENEELLITNLPRSVRDHLTNSIAFQGNNSNILYFLQGSNSAAGNPDSSWGNREETLLTAAVLRLDLTKLPTNLPLDAETSQSLSVINNANINSPALSDGTYNPYFQNAPLTIYATGLRNAFDLVWHSNGQLYVPTNGTAGGPITPPSVQGTRRIDGSFYNGPDIPKIEQAGTQRDWLFRIDPTNPFGYYGHPNPKRGEYVMNRGPIDVPKYPASVQPDANFRGAAFDFEFNKSPNGVVEYKGEGALKGALIVCRYSGGSDLIVLVPDGPNGDIKTSKIGVPGFTGFEDPIDLTEDFRNGNLYVSDLKTQKIVLLRPQNLGLLPTDIVLTSDPEELIFDGIKNRALGVQEVLITNNSESSVTLTDLSISGGAASQYAIESSGTLPLTLSRGSSTTVGVTYSTGSTSGNFDSNLNIKQNDGNTFQIGLYGLTTNGFGGGGEPPLQNIVNAVGYNINVGSTALNLPTDSSVIGDEILFSIFEKAGSEPVVIKPIARYSPLEPVSFGFYNNENVNARQEALSLLEENEETQTLFPEIASGSTSVETSASSFGIYLNRKENITIYSQDALNSENPVAHGMRIYPLKDRRGVAIPNAYLFAIEEAGNGDYNDYVFAVFNIRPTNKATENSLPLVSFSRPEDGDIYRSGEPLTITAIASDTDGTIVNVALFLNNELIREDDTAPYEWSNTDDADLANLGEGSYELKVVATDDKGGISEEIVTITITASGAEIKVENLAKLIGTDKSFPADDYIAFSTIRDRRGRRVTEFGRLKINNTGSEDLRVNDITISNNDFILPNGEGTEDIVIAPNGSYELLIQFVKSSGGKGVYKSVMEISSNDTANPVVTVTLAGGYMVAPEGGNELNPFQIYNELFNLKTVLDGDGIFSSTYPTEKSLLSGEQGDLVVSREWQQADPSKPVGVTYMNAFKSSGGANCRFENEQGEIVGGINLDFGGTWNNSIFPRRGNNDSKGSLYGVATNTINENFLISIAGRTTVGDNGINPETGTSNDLRIRVYKVIDADGNLVPNEYFALMDYTRTNCTTNGGSCDYNDNGVYLVNVKPVNPIVPITLTASSSQEVAIKEQEELEESSINVYPNPTKGELFIDVSSLLGEAVELVLFNISGRELYREFLDESHGSIVSLDLTSFQNDNYILGIISEETGMVTKQIILTK